MARTAGPETHHTRILEEFRQKIVDRIWGPGFQLDKETDLATQYGVSRMTMNKVLTQLAQEGFVVRRKRSGTFVSKARTQAAVMPINNLADEVEALGKTYRWQLFAAEIRVPQTAELRLLGVESPPIPDEVIVLRGMHYADDEPFCLETRAINVDVVPNAREVDFATHVPGHWLLQSMPWSTARNAIRAVNVAGSEARNLDLPVGAACLEILRKTVMGSDWVTYARLLYPGEAFQLTAEFKTKATPKALAPQS